MSAVPVFAVKIIGMITLCVYLIFLLLLLSSYDVVLLLGEEAEASPSIGNTLWRVSTMFTRLAITLPEANGFG